MSIDDDGKTVPIMWASPDMRLSEHYGPAIIGLAERVARAKIVSAFYSSKKTWGEPVTGKWTHYSVTPPASMVHKALATTAGQKMAASKERRRIIVEALKDFSPALLDEALRVLKADAVTQAERFVAPLQWLRDLHDRPKGREGVNLLWLAVSIAPEGFCHPRAGMTGSLLEDIAEGMPFEKVQSRWNAKMHPLQYQRPQAAPAAGAIKAAEELVAKLGIGPSLERRFARLDEVKTIWRPVASETPAPSGGIFSHLKAKNVQEVQSLAIPAQRMTWHKFKNTALKPAHRLQLHVPYRGDFVAMLTAQNPDAPPIIKWDTEENPYPVSSYRYHTGSNASTWGLLPNTLAEVTAICPKPSAFDDADPGVILILEGAKDSRTNQGNALFPEILKSDLHGVRSVIEAYSKHAVIGGVEDASACGLGVGKGDLGFTIRAYDGKSWLDYKIDRWD